MINEPCEAAEVPTDRRHRNQLFPLLNSGLEWDHWNSYSWKEKKGS